MLNLFTNIVDTLQNLHEQRTCHKNKKVTVDYQKIQLFCYFLSAIFMIKTFNAKHDDLKYF